MADTLFVIEHSPGPAWTAGVVYQQQPGIRVHMEFMRSLHDRGLLVLGGPFLDQPDGAHVGMAIVGSESLDAAETLAAADASVAGGLLRCRIRHWLVPMGTVLDEAPPRRSRAAAQRR